MAFTPFNALLLVVLCLFHFSANAAFVRECEPWLEDRFDVAADCQISTRSSQDFRGGQKLTVNQDAFFAKQDWDHAITLEGGSGSGLSGYLTLPEWLLEDAESEFLVIFKGPSLHRLVGIHLRAPWDGTGFLWLSPFKHFKNPSKYMEVSHISIYRRPSDILSPVPPLPMDIPAGTPAGVLMIGLMLFYLRQKRHRHG